MTYTKWEYLVIGSKSTVEDHELNKFGNEGWEMTGVLHLPTDGIYVYYFKRRAEE